MTPKSAVARVAVAAPASARPAPALLPGWGPDGPSTGSGSAGRGAPSPPRAQSPVEALRQHLAGKSAREHVVLDFLEDDLAEARAAMAAVAAYVANVDSALRDPEPSQRRFLSLAIGGAPIEKMETLAQSLSSVRRRLAQVAARM